MKIEDIKVGCTYLWHDTIVTVRRKFSKTLTLDAWNPWGTKLIVHRGISPDMIQPCPRIPLAND